MLGALVVGYYCEDPFLQLGRDEVKFNQRIHTRCSIAYSEAPSIPEPDIVIETTAVIVLEMVNDMISEMVRLFVIECVTASVRVRDLEVLMLSVFEDVRTSERV
eukprot:gene2896-biopygen11734